MKRSLLILLLITNSQVCHARLGETEKQVYARYGKGKLVRGWHIFFFQGFEVGVRILDGKSVMEIYSDQNGAALTDTKVQALLSANGAGKRWLKGSRDVYSRTDGKARAVISNGRSGLTIATVEGFEMMGKREDSQMSGF
jgi:hypothetical protein